MHACIDRPAVRTRCHSVSPDPAADARFLLLLLLFPLVFAGPALPSASGASSVDERPATVVISEFMASNTRTVTDGDSGFEDWIELRNLGSSPVDLSGWALSGNRRQPLRWRFPATNLAPAGHLLVWASGRDRRVPGEPLHTSFRLAADGEYLALARPDGSIASAFAPRYPRQWPDVSYGFLPGSTQAVLFTAPTPGRPNESTPTPPGPTIASVAHAPAAPEPGRPIVVTARIHAAQADHPVTTVLLAWCTMFQPEKELPMTAGPGGAWSATLPPDAAAPGQMIRWRVIARDSGGAVATHPPDSRSRTSSRYLGTVVHPGSISSQLPVFHLFLPPDVDAADTEGGTTGCLFHDGEFYDRVHVKLRGNTTASFPKRSHRLEFPNDHRFRHPGPGPPVRNTSLMAEWGDPTYLRQHLSFWLQQETGSPAPFHHPVRVQLNGAFWQLALHSEVLGEDLLARHGLDPRGALYKAVGTVDPWGHSTGGFEKKTRRKEGNRDYTALAQALSSKLPPEQRRRALFDRLNLPAVINYIAVARITQEDDDIWANLSLYHDNEDTGEWRPIPFDMNVSWGFSFAAGGILANQDRHRSHPFFGAANTGNLHGGGGYNHLYDAIVQIPETRAMLLRRLRTIMDRWLQPPGTPPDERMIERHIADLTRLIAPDAALDRARWGNCWYTGRNVPPDQSLDAGVRSLVDQFLEPRRQHLFVTHCVTNASFLRPVGVTSRHIAGIPLPQPARPPLQLGRLQSHPDQPGLDHVTVINAGPDAIDLSGWTLAGPARFIFAPGTVIPPRGFLHVAAQLRTFRSQPGPPPAIPRFVVGNLRLTGDTRRPLTLLDDRRNLIASRPPDPP